MVNSVKNLITSKSLIPEILWLMSQKDITAASLKRTGKNGSALDKRGRKRIFESLIVVKEIASLPTGGQGFRLAMTRKDSDG
jgi:hypothetical protein